MTISEANKLVDEYATVVSYNKVVYYREALKIVEIIVNKMQAEIDKLSVENAKKEAKVYAYEAILENSNFKMAVINRAKKNND